MLFDLKWNGKTGRTGEGKGVGGVGENKEEEEEEVMKAMYEIWREQLIGSTFLVI